MELFAGVLYPSRLHWLGLPAVEKIVVSHFFEKDKVAQVISAWLSNYYWPSISKGDKCKLWNLNFKLGEHLRDERISQTYIDHQNIICEEMESNGHYPIKLRTVTLDTKRGFSDWLDYLIVEPVVLNGDDGDVSLRDTPNVVVLHLEGISKVFRWPIFKQISRLQGDEVEVCSAVNLNIGDELIILTSSEDQIATQREIFDMFVENNHGLEQSLRIANKWNEYVNLGYEKLEKSLGNLHKYLNNNRLFIHKSTVQNWLNGGVIGPQDSNAIRIFAELAQVPNASKMSQVIAQAISLIRSEHRRIGGDIRRAIAISRGRDVSAVQIGTRRFSREIFDSMIQVAKVVHIQRSSVDQIDISSHGIKDIAKKYSLQYPNKLIFTQNCERVMRNSEFLNIESFNKQRKSAFQIKKYNETLYYQGTYELDFLNYINNKNMIDLIEQDIVIDYVYNKKNKKYYPDFFIKKYNLIIEIKSRYIYYKELEKNIAKINKCLADGYNFILIIDKKYTYFDEIIKEIIKQKTT